MIALGALIVGLGLGLACGGSPSRLGSFRLKFERTLLTIFVIQAVARGRIGGEALPWATGIWTLASVGLVVVLVVNYQKPGMVLGALGVLLNLDATLINSGMPVAGLGRGTIDAVAASGGQYVLTGAHTMGSWLGDVLPLTLGREGLLLSVGDVILLVAMISVLVFEMTRGEESGQAVPSRERGAGIRA